MSLLDKYEVVISPNIGPVMNSNCKDVNYYFENLIKNNTRVFLSEFISRQINDDNAIDVEKIIHDFLNDYIKTIRKNLRMSIKRRNSVSIVESFISLINNFSNKIYELEYFTKDINFKNVCFKNLFNSVLCDPITTVIFSRDIMDLSQKGKIKYLFLKI